MDERIIKIKELIADEAFVKELLGKVTAEDAQACFAAKGVDFSIDEINALAEKLNSYMKDSGDALSEEELEAVSGGDAMDVVGEVLTTIDKITSWFPLIW